MSFRRKVTFVLIFFNTSLILAVAGFTYPRASREQFEGMRQKVRGIAATAALSIDGDLHPTIPPDPAAHENPDYQDLQRQLKRVLGANPGIRYVWTMVKSDKPGETIFVGDVGGGTSKPGLKYDASGIPQLWKGFRQPAADRSPVKDPWGVSVSGYAPIRNRSGEAVAVLGVDMYGRELFHFRRKFQLFLGLSLALGIALAVLIGGLVARWIARPLALLIQGMRRIGGGELTYELKLPTGDEFQEAANTFNRMGADLRLARDKLKESFFKTIQALMSALEAKDPYTRGHSASVTQYAIEVAQEMEKSAQEIDTLSRLALLHDVGKIGIQDSVLQKPGIFTEEERRIMQRHPEIGGKILAPLQLTEEELSLIVEHHEREDGTGYPQRLDRGQISDLAAIVSVADAYDAMTSHRPYRHTLKPEQAMEELRKGAGTQFRPEVVEALIRVLQKKGILTLPT